MRRNITKTTTASELLIDIQGGKQIKIYTLKITMIGTDNVVSIMQGTDLIDKYVLVNSGQIEGIALDTRPVYTSNTHVNIICSNTQEINVFVDYEII